MKIKHLLFCTSLVAVAAGCAFSQGPTVKRTTTKTDRFDFGAGGTVALAGAPNGSVTVVGTSKNEIEITAIVEVQAATEADLAVIAPVSGFLTDESPSKTTISTVGPYNKFLLKKLPKNLPKNLMALPFRVDYTIKVPRYCDLEIDGGKGDLSITNVEGSMRVNFLESNARAEVIAGTTVLNIGKGDLDVALGVRGWKGRSADISVGSGNLTVRLPSNMSAEIDATVMKTGSIVNNLADLKPRDRKIPFTETSIRAKAGVGGAALKFTVGDGTLTMATLVNSK